LEGRRGQELEPTSLLVLHLRTFKCTSVD
jgi:hypothetical protein